MLFTNEKSALISGKGGDLFNNGNPSSQKRRIHDFSKQPQIRAAVKKEKRDFKGKLSSRDGHSGKKK